MVKVSNFSFAERVCKNNKAIFIVIDVIFMQSWAKIM